MMASIIALRRREGSVSRLPHFVQMALAAVIPQLSLRTG
jgi:hypothetical protein